ncbi:MAG: nucleotidyl transferase AbiEii/AbiGii toxin family protein [Candidatus Thermoplasmatota archaeon]|nr:nucleotidyl transferase AbiEii/AbiGii toxin family protein [Candidatus Thermoplasmatota archaeon]MBU1941379.1 nucleotidyl transferase AbiEii/AbiGii toxin family protein [Candidatus Thermoplasmatota archaeon]
MQWDDIITHSTQAGVNPHQLFREEIQKAILTSLSREGAFTTLVFQGGTALKLFYNNPRFSEDLDFVLHHKTTPYDLTQNITKISSFVMNSFPFLTKTTLTTQKNTKELQRLILRTQADLPDQCLRIHIELVSIPSHHNIPRILIYPPLNPVVRVEEPTEILADKIVAVGLRPYLKGRDLWDIYFLTTEHHLITPWDLVFQKANDYGTPSPTLKHALLTATLTIRDEGTTILANEMKRFLPLSILNQYSIMFDSIITTVAHLIEQVNNIKPSE